MRKLASFALAATILGTTTKAQGKLNRVSPEDFLVDAYDNVPYANRPLASEELSGDRDAASNYLRQMEPDLGSVDVNEVQSLNLDPESMVRRKLDVMELNLMNFIEEEIPEIADLRHENEDHEFEINHFLKLRRAELKELDSKIESQESKLEKVMAQKQDDIQEVKDSIHRYYEEIDLHLEDPSTSYNDDYIMHRKRMIRKLMKKEMALERDFRERDYRAVQRVDKSLSFLRERREEILRHSREMSFPFVKRKLSYIEKNNARINYLVSRLPSRRLDVVQDMLSTMRRMRARLEDLSASSAKSREQRSLEEDVRFEERYYSELKKEDTRAMREARKLRKMQEKYSSEARSQGSGAVEPHPSNRKKDSAGRQYVYVLPMDQIENLRSMESATRAPRAQDAAAPTTHPKEKSGRMKAPLPGLQEQKAPRSEDRVQVLPPSAKSESYELPPLIDGEEEVKMPPSPAQETPPDPEAEQKTEVKTTAEAEDVMGFGESDEFLLGDES